MPDGRVRIRTLRAVHQTLSGDPVEMEATQESDGTNRLLHLAPALYRMHLGDAVFVIDEIDRSLHPMMVIEFLKAFLRSAPGSRSQLIVTTHESRLLDLELLRRDEIWFAEKDHSGATHLYSLSDFKVRNDLDIRKHYFQGRFGGVPFLGDLPSLLEAEASRD